MPGIIPGESHAATRSASVRTLYWRLLRDDADASCSAAAETFLAQRLVAARAVTVDLPDHPAQLEHWALARARTVGDAFRAYLRARRDGAARRLFRHRAHALHFLRAVAPTKLVDGSWLYGLLRFWRDTRIRTLVATYLDELGAGDIRHNHVAIYRRLLAAHDCDDLRGVPDACFLQGATQLALAHCGARYLPEVIGYNLGYEQPPLHLLITARELRELGIDPAYFTLHVTIDNAASGHALLAVRAVGDALPRLADREAFWRRVRTGYALSELGPGALDAIAAFDADAEVLRILRDKAGAGCGMHGDHARIAGRTVNEWLSRPDHMPALLSALQREGWIVRGATPSRSRFWRLLEGDGAPMAGVFTGYERELIRNWIAGGEGETAPDTAHDGSSAFRAVRVRPMVPRATPANREQEDVPASADDGDEILLRRRLGGCKDPEAAMGLLLPLLAPAAHDTPAGLLATRLFARLFRGDALAMALARETARRLH